MDSTRTNAYLRCIEPDCLSKYPITRLIYTCPECGGLLDVDYDFSLGDAGALKQTFRARKVSEAGLDLSGVWRFRELLPFVEDFSEVVTLGEGNTPIYDAPRSADYSGMGALRFKHQGMNPTGSF